MSHKIASIRKEYRLKSLDESHVAPDAILQFSHWWEEAVKSEIEEVNAMTLATASADGIPSARIVLLKGFDDNGFVFFTNYQSAKGRQLDENPKAALVFFWKELERQVRITGTVKKVSEIESDNYFQSRPAGSKIGAWASPQSSVINQRSVLEENIKKYTGQFHLQIPRPPFWGGYVVNPETIEFWQGGSSRLHDRIKYTKLSTNKWKIERLAP